MSSIYISLIAHENFDFLKLQLLNLNRFLPSARVFLHLSALFDLDIHQKTIIENLNFVTISKERIHTDLFALLAPHVINIKEILKTSRSQSDKIIFMSSNELFIMSGAEQYIKNHDFGAFENANINNSLNKGIIESCKSDDAFIECLSALGIDNIIWSQIEGSFYRADILRNFIKYISFDEHRLLSKKQYYPEEIILPTLTNFAMLGNSYQKGFPITFSEVSIYVKHSYLFNFCQSDPVRRYLIKFFSLILGSRISIFKVMILSSRAALIFKPYAIVGITKRYDINNIYSVKRVPRSVDSILVKFIMR